jgi:hypothetical protein
VVEKETQTGYLSNIVEDGQVYTMVGIGLRKVYGFKVYGMALYLEDVPARAEMAKVAQRAGGKDLAHLTTDDLAQSFILFHDFGKIAILKFVREVKGADLVSAYRDSINDELKMQTPALKKDIEKFVGLFAHDVKKDDECIIRTTSRGEMSVEIGGYKLGGPTNPQLAQAIWNIWLGKRPISSDLRKALVGRIDALTK